ncbi:MAG: GNAT family N-acetyltransferase [FCB group bacterium]|nr:GNAT family N-acetyltransferase [FCB group bacterium]
MMIDDYEAVFNLWNGMEGIGLSASDELEQIEAYLHRNPGLSLVAVCRETLIGAVLCGHDGRRGYIHHLAIHPDNRSRGIGTRMVQDCLKRLTVLGIQKCHIFLIPENQKGFEFWSRAGFYFRDDLELMSIDLE